MTTKILCFVPAFGQQITAATFLTSHALMMSLTQKGIAGGISTLSFPDIAELRSMATTIWYDTMPDTTHLLFVDADMGFPPELVTDMLLFNEPVVGTIYPQRRVPISWAGSGTGEAQAERRGDFMRVEGVGMGCTLIRRDCITTMLEKMPELSDYRIELHPAKEMILKAGAKRLIRCFEKLDIPTRGVVSEDLSFCIRWAQCGGQVWAAIGHKISHVGPYDYQGRYLDMVNQQAVHQPMAPAVAATAVSPEPVGAPEVGIPTHEIPPAPPEVAPIEIVAAPVFEQANGGEPPVPVKRKRGRPRKNPVQTEAAA